MLYRSKIKAVVIKNIATNIQIKQNGCNVVGMLEVNKTLAIKNIG